MPALYCASASPFCSGFSGLVVRAVFVSGRVFVGPRLRLGPRDFVSGRVDFVSGRVVFVSGRVSFSGFAAGRVVFVVGLGLGARELVGLGRVGLGRLGLRRVGRVGVRIDRARRRDRGGAGRREGGRGGAGRRARGRVERCRSSRPSPSRQPSRHRQRRPRSRRPSPTCRGAALPVVSTAAATFDPVVSGVAAALLPCSVVATRRRCVLLLRAAETERDDRDHRGEHDAATDQVHQQLAAVRRRLVEVVVVDRLVRIGAPAPAGEHVFGLATG